MTSKALTLILPAVAGTALSACAATGETQPAQFSEREARIVSKALEGKVAGPPERCVSRVLSTDGLRPVSDRVVLYRVNRNLTYRNDLNGICSGLGSGGALVLHPTNDQYCRGDIAFVYDPGIQMRTGSCVLGDFVPYRTPGK